MKQYYLYDGKKSQGPYTILKLKKKNISKDTPIFYHGLPEWTTAEYVPELKIITDQYVEPQFFMQTNNSFVYKAAALAILLGIAVYFTTQNWPEKSISNTTTIKK